MGGWVGERVGGTEERWDVADGRMDRELCHFSEERERPLPLWPPHKLAQPGPEN